MPPALPSKGSVCGAVKQWEEYTRQINKMIREYRDEQHEKALKEEIKEYENEGERARLERWHDFHEWVFEEIEGKCDEDGIQCGSGECWYVGNLDRLHEYTGCYRFFGTRDVYMCDLCIVGIEDNDPCKDMEELMFESLVEHCTHDWDDYYGECKLCKKPCEHEFCIDRCDICGYDKV